MCKWIFFTITFLYNGARAQSLSGIYSDLLPYSSVQKNVLAFPANQAALAHYGKFSGGIYGERRFLLQELSHYDLALAFPTASGSFGIVSNYTGSGAQQETRLALAYARRMGQISAGLQFNRHSIITKGYGQFSFISVEGGLLLQLGQFLRSGLHFVHATGPPGRYYGAPSMVSAGLGYDASRQFFIGLLFIKTEDRDLQVQTGFEYNWQFLNVRAGLSAATGLFYFGVGFLLRDFRIDLTVSMHPQLGMTPGLALLYPSIHEK